MTDALRDSYERKRISAPMSVMIAALWVVVNTANELHHIHSQALDVVLCIVTLAGCILCLIDYVRRSSLRHRTARARACDPIRFLLLPTMFLFGVGLTQWLTRALTGGMQEYLNPAYLAWLPWAMAGYLQYRRSISAHRRQL